MVPSSVASTSAARVPPAIMRIVSWNVNGLYTTLKDASARYSSVSSYFSDVLKADIVCFQEAKIQEEKLEKWMACVPGYESYWAFSKSKKGYSGVVNYVKDGISPLDAHADYLGDFDDPLLDELCSEGRLVETDHGSFVLINVYAPNAGEREQGRLRLHFKLRFLKALKRKCDELVNSGRHFIIVGDLNVAHKDKDVHRSWNIRDIFSPEEINFMDAMFNDYVDLFRHFHPHEEDVFSVWNQKTEARIHNEGLRIDYAVCDRQFLSQIVSTDIVKMFPKNWSDHASIQVVLKEQPILPAHPSPAMSSSNMKRFKEDSKQKRLTALFSPSAKCSEQETDKDGKQTNDLSCFKKSLEPGKASDTTITELLDDHKAEGAKNKIRKTDSQYDTSTLKVSGVSSLKPSSSQKNLKSYFQTGAR